MRIPLPRNLSLGETAAYVAARCQVSIESTQAALDRAFREYSIMLYDDETLKSIQGLRGATIDWGNSSVIGGEYLTINGIRYTVRVHVYRSHLDQWLGRRASSAPPPESASPGPIYRTGLPGKPSTWHLLEIECRRRYADGERHTNEKTGRESPSEWATILIAWLKLAHPDVAPAAPKALTNRLSILLRELEAACA